MMRQTIGIFAVLALLAASSIHAEKPKLTVALLSPTARKLIIDPSSTAVPLGKARLVVSPLVHEDGNYIGEYQLKVKPYFFKNETGSLILGASEDALRTLQAGRPIEFKGKAVTREDGTSHVVLGKATPSSDDRGNVTFFIITDNGKFIFSSSYHFGT